MSKDKTKLLNLLTEYYNLNEEYLKLTRITFECKKKMDKIDDIKKNHINLNFKVAGAFYRKDNLQDLKIGDLLIMKPDKNNDHDKNAIGVYSNHELCGYVPKHMTHGLKDFIDYKLEIIELFREYGEIVGIYVKINMEKKNIKVIAIC